MHNMDEVQHTVTVCQTALLDYINIETSYQEGTRSQG